MGDWWPPMAAEITVGLHYSLDRIAPALSGQPVGWEMDAFTLLRQAYAQGDTPPKA